MHLSPTMETNFVCGCFCANVRTCSNARSLRGRLVSVVSTATEYAKCVEDNPPVLVQETHDTGALARQIGILAVYLARLCHLARVVLPADGVHPSEACVREPLHLAEPLPAHLLDDPRGLVVVRILRGILQLVNVQVLELVLEGWCRGRRR